LSAEFFNFFNHGFVRVAVAVPEVRVADPRFNVERTIAMMHEAAESAACVVVFPELGLSGYTCDDLFHQRALLDAVIAGLDEILSASKQLALLVVVGAPLVVEQRLFNAALSCRKGEYLALCRKYICPTIVNSTNRASSIQRRTRRCEKLSFAGKATLPSVQM
jgi:NAD+ synthase (glutamine-hydrolysing)